MTLLNHDETWNPIGWHDENGFWHYGVKGQKWGVTTKRKGGGSSSPRTDVKSMSDKELTTLTARMNLERNYLTALGKDGPKSSIAAATAKKGAQEVGKLVFGSAETAVKRQLTAAFTRQITAWLTKRAANV